MNKEEYLYKLSETLKSIPESEKQDILYDYNEYFENGALEGRSEEEISKSLGNPEQVLESFDFEKPKNVFLKKIVACSALVMFNILFIIGPLACVLLFLLILFTGSVAVTVAGSMMVLEPVFQLVVPHYFIFEPFVKLLIPQFEVIPASSIVYALVGMITAVSGIATMVLSVYITKLFHNGVLWYLKLNLDIVNG
ncbi:HAAS signaling domain-containing protein [Methanococcus sp. CF]